MINELPLTERLHRMLNPEPPFDLGYTYPFWGGSRQEPAEAEPESEEPEPEETEPAEADEVAALPPVVTPPQRDMGAEVRALLAPVGQRLDLLEVSEDLREQRDELLIELASFSERLAEFLTDHRQQLVKRLADERERAAGLCRQQEQVVEAASSAVSEYQAEKRRRNAAVAAAESALASWEAQKASLGRWPSDLQLRQWETKYRALKEAATAAESAVGQSFEEERRLIRASNEEKQKLAALDQQFWILSKRLAGESYADPETGLIVPPEL